MTDLTSEGLVVRRRESSDRHTTTSRVGRNGRGGSQPHQKVRRRIANYLSRPFGYLGTLVFTLVTIGALFLGWLNRKEGYLTAEEGLGYLLGIIGG